MSRKKKQMPWAGPKQRRKVYGQREVYLPMPFLQTEQSISNPSFGIVREISPWPGGPPPKVIGYVELGKAASGEQRGTEPVSQSFYDMMAEASTKLGNELREHLNVPPEGDQSPRAQTWDWLYNGGPEPKQSNT